MARRRGLRRLVPAMAGLLLAGLATACSGGSPPPAQGLPAVTVGPSGTTADAPSADPTGDPTVSPTVDGSSTMPARPAGLQGKIVTIDPGHNGGNSSHGAEISHEVDIGNGSKECDTTGTETDAGYHESAFALDVSLRLAALLRAQGATVVLTRQNDRGVGPCITERAAIGNRARANAAVSIHGDGAPAAGYGFHVIVPRGIGSNDAIVAPSRRLGTAVRDAFRAGTGEPLSTYTGTTTGGLVARSDLGGLNLSTIPKVFIECGNMRNAQDAARMTSVAWRQKAAAALAAGLTAYLTSTTS